VIAMTVERVGDKVQVVLEAAEVALLRRALERASFIDTPMSEQAAIANFCARALELLPAPPRR
jgi:hypothetical protein